MIRNLRVQNYKSIVELDIELGRVNVLIGANGSGKSNILEAIALASAAVQDKLDNEFLSSRGIRVTEPRFMHAAFAEGAIPPVDGPPMPEKKGKTNRMKSYARVEVRGDNNVAFGCHLVTHDSGVDLRWSPTYSMRVKELLKLFKKLEVDPATKVTPELLRRAVSPQAGTLPSFLIYSPENSALRTFQSEGQILPLGSRGEGLFAYLKHLSEKNRKVVSQIKKSVGLIDWFENFAIPSDLGPGERSIRIRDRYLADGLLFDQRSANEGFLFLLFYFTLFASPATPSFFAIDNVDTSLNPKLCTQMVRQLALLASLKDKQFIATTHNPAVLDGLDLDDPEQRLFVVERSKQGHTRIRRVAPPKPPAGELPVSLSQAFMRGYIGGLPKNF